MRDRYREARRGCQLLPRDLPQPDPGSMTAAPVRGNQQSLGVGRELPSHHGPPPTEALDGTRRRVMIRAHRHPPRIGRGVRDTVRSDGAKGIARKVMDTDLRWIALGAELTAMVAKLAPQVCLLGVYRNHRLPQGQLIVGW